MNYIKHYNKLCELKKTLTRSKEHGCFELHHIIPRCKGGNNSKNNLVLLTPREHYIAHRLLWLHYRDRQTAMAFWAMNRGRVMDSRTYQAAKEANVFAQKGKKLSKEVRDKIKANNARTGKPNWNSGKEFSKSKVQCSKCGDYTSIDMNRRWHEGSCQLAEFELLLKLHTRKEIRILKDISNARLQYWVNKVKDKSK